MALSLSRNKIPPSINYAGPNPYIDFDATPHLKVADTVTDWPRYSGHAIAGVSGFGFGGANAHLVLREVLRQISSHPEPEPDWLPTRTTRPMRTPPTSVASGSTRTETFSPRTSTRTSTTSMAPSPTAAWRRLRRSGPPRPDRRSTTSAGSRRAELDAAEPRTPVVPLADGDSSSRKLGRPPRNWPTGSTAPGAGRPRWKIHRPLTVAAQPRPLAGSRHGP